MARTEISKEAAEALRVLVDRAQYWLEPMGYRELGDQIGVHWRNVGKFLGEIRDDVCGPGGHPPINWLVVKQDTGLPGDGVVPGGAKHLGPDEKKALFEKLTDRVFEYDRWEEVLAECGLEPIERPNRDFENLAREYVSFEQRRGGTGEGPEHRSLKEYVAAHPELLGIPHGAEATLEEGLPSGDRCDVIFGWGKQVAVVEVKVGAPRELAKGVYQAIKYRALVEAEKGQGRPYAVGAFLVAYQMQRDLRDWAAMFDIQCVRVDREKVTEEDA